jgi:hypothetical protein
MKEYFSFVFRSLWPAPVRDVSFENDKVMANHVRLVKG